MAREVGPLDRLVTLPLGEPALTLGWEAVKFGTKYLRQPNGPHAGQRWQPTMSQVRFLLHWYGLNEDGTWIYRRAVRRLAKGSGKSPFAAVIALIELCAPVRLKDFDPKIKGGCVGKPVAMPLVQIAATAESQTDNTMRMVRAFAPKGSRIVRDFDLDPGEKRYNKAGGGKLHVLTSSSTAAEGGEPTCVVGDEPEHWLPGNGGIVFASTLADNLAKSGSRMIETCNSWMPGKESVAESSFLAWVSQEEGHARGSTKILYDARVAPPTAVLTDTPDHSKGETGVTEALKFVYDDCWWADLEFIKERIWDLQASSADSRRKYFNQPTADEDAWIEPQDWAKLSRPDEVVAAKEAVCLFFDGSKSRDATALMGCRMSDGHVFTVGVWEPDTAHNADDVVPVGAVDSAVIGAHEKYDVVAFFADVQEWQGFVKVTWPDRYKDRYVIMAAPAAREPMSIAWDMRSRAYDFAEATETCLEEILQQGFTHDGNAVVARHVGNARRHDYKGRTSISKESKDSPRKIDAAVCVVGVRMVRRLVLASKEWQKRKKGHGKGRAILLD